MLAAAEAAPVMAIGAVVRHIGTPTLIRGVAEDDLDRQLVGGVETSTHPEESGIRTPGVTGTGVHISPITIFIVVGCCWEEGGLGGQGSCPGSLVKVCMALAGVVVEETHLLILMINSIHQS